MTDQEIYTIYEAGPAAVLTLVRGLLERLDEQQTQLTRLTDRLKKLEDERAQNSRNSSKPPSSDQSKPAPKSLRQHSGNKPGGQPGHRGDTLKMVAQPDRLVCHSPLACRRCGTSLETVEALDEQPRQVFDLPEPRLEVVEHRRQEKCCPCCGASNLGAFPAQVSAPVQYGPRLQALAVYLLSFQLLPYSRTAEFFADVFGQAISAGTLHEAIKGCYAQLEQPEAEIKQHLVEAEVGHFDETGFFVEARRQWLHVASTKQLTHYGWHAKRGSSATDEIGILPSFTGVAVHDGWRSYRQYESDHALCNAHHLRELVFLEEQHGQTWSPKMQGLLLEIKQAVSQAKAEGMVVLPASVREGYWDRYAAILREGFAANPPPAEGPKRRGRKKQSKAKNLLDRLSRDQVEVLRFMEDFRVPFDNNQAERDVRMMKVKQKISGGFRSGEGASYFCRIRGYVSTMRKQGQGILTALERVFSGDPIPILIPE